MKTFKSISATLFLLCCSFYTEAQTLCGNTQANFTVIQNGPTTGLQSTSTGTPGGALYQWWMNGNVVTNPNPNQVYTLGSLPDGSYVFCLYVYADTNTLCDSICQEHTINTGSNLCDSLSAEFTVSYNTNGNVQFTNVPNQGNVTHYWDFGDGTTANVPNPVHCYTNAGGRYVFHRVEIPGTACFDTISRYVQSGVSTCSDSCAGFSVSVDSATTPNGTYLQANVNGGSAPYTYIWSNGVSPQSFITNLTPGTYCVTVTDAAGCTASACDTVYGSACNAAFSWNPINCNTVHFVSLSQDTGVHYQWNFGDGTTSTLANPQHVFTAGVWTVVLTVYNANTQCQNSYTAVITVQSCVRDTVCGVVFNDANNNGILDSTETGLAGVMVYIDNTVAVTDSFGHYTAVVPAGSHSIRIMLLSGCVLTLPLNPNSNATSGHSYFFTPASSQGATYCGYNFGIHCSAVTICGAVYVDANNNQIQENSEAGIIGVHLTLTSTNGNVYHTYTNPNGNYCITVPAGTYTVTVVSTVFGTLSTPSITVNAATTGNTYNNNDFPVYVQPGTCDLKVDIIPQTTFTPGFAAYYYVRVWNIGGNASGGTLEFMYEPALSYISSNPVGTNNAAAYTVSWNVAPLAVGTYRNYFVRFFASTQLAIGQPAFALANITTDAACTDVNLNNNIDTIHQTVTGSWDPNNKLAYKTNHETNTDYQWVSSHNADQRLEYVINFQNEGNGPAVNVVVKNVITPDLDLNSFELLGMSHEGVVVQNGSEFNFKFSNIMLAPKEVDEPNSSGWVRYAINAVGNLPVGHVIAEPADIYFDFNEAVVTNDGAVILLDVTGIDETAREQTIIVAPNPMNEYTRITLNNSQADNFRFRVMDVAGRVVSDETATGNTLLFNRNALSAGLYTYQVIQNNNISAKGKLIMQ